MHQPFKQRIFMLTFIAIVPFITFALLTKIKIVPEDTIFILVEKPMENWVNIEIQSFKNSNSEDWNFQIESFTREERIWKINQFKKAIIIDSEYFNSEELEAASSFGRSFNQISLVDDDSNKNVFLIYNPQLEKRERKFKNFLLSDEGQNILNKKISQILKP